MRGSDIKYMPAVVFAQTLILNENLYLWADNNLPAMVVPEKMLIFFIRMEETWNIKM